MGFLFPIFLLLDNDITVLVVIIRIALAVLRSLFVATRLLSVTITAAIFRLLLVLAPALIIAIVGQCQCRRDYEINDYYQQGEKLYKISIHSNNFFLAQSVIPVASALTLTILMPHPRVFQNVSLTIWKQRFYPFQVDFDGVDVHTNHAEKYPIPCRDMPHLAPVGVGAGRVRLLFTRATSFPVRSHARLTALHTLVNSAMQANEQSVIEPLEVNIPPRIQGLVAAGAQAFRQCHEGLVARPLGLDLATCRRAVEVCARLHNNNGAVLNAEELMALFHVLEFTRRELAAEFHADLRDLQKAMASIVTARASKEIERFASDLPRQAEKAGARLRDTIKRRGELLDECEAVIKKLRAHLRLPKPQV